MKDKRLSFEYVYNLNGRIPVFNSFAVFMYNKMANNNTCRTGMYEKEEKIFDLSDLLKGMRIEYNKSYRTWFTGYRRMTVKRANMLLEKKHIPFVIEEISLEGQIRKKYRLKYTGGIEPRYTWDFLTIVNLDGIYLLFDAASKYSPLSEKNMNKLCANLHELIHVNDNLKSLFASQDVYTVKGLIEVINKLELPFHIQTIKHDDSTVSYLIMKVDNS